VHEPLPRHLSAKPRKKSVCQDAAKVIEPKLDDTQCGFRCGRGTTEQISNLQQIFEKSWEHVKDLYRYFVDPGKVYGLCGRVLREKLWGVLWEYGVDGCLFPAVKSLHSCLEGCVRVGRVKSRPFSVGVRLRQWCVLFF